MPRQGRPPRPKSARARHDTRPPRNRTHDIAAPPESPPRERIAARPPRRANLRELLDGIGTPAPAPFIPDSFQLEALARLEHEDVLVTAPTGSGKTWIAREEIRRLLAAGRRVWYTSPLKALTNSKYVEFAAEFGAESVGILTGDRKENAVAPLIVGTTEVYRNQLFDALRQGESTTVDLVILDEAHYLGDEERGHVWEETIILCPPRVRLLLLSATVGNAQELARWIATVRGTKCSVVERRNTHGKLEPRPVELRAAFLFPDGGLAPLVTANKNKHADEARRGERDETRHDGRGHDGRRRDQRERDKQQHDELSARELNPEVRAFLQRAGGGQPRTQPARWAGGAARQVRPEMPEVAPADLLSALGGYDLLPAIIFLPTRRRCDEAAAEAAHGARTRAHERQAARARFLEEFSEAHPEIRRHRQREATVKSGVASHHAGHLPAWKAAIEHLMSRGLLDAIFATSTVAAGVDFPARTVVLTVGDMRTNRGWRPLGASEFQQMTGRAGRRGRDQVGFIVVAPGRHQNPQRIATLLDSAPDNLISGFRATYTSLLNLLDAYGGFRQVREIVERSFAHVETARRLVRLDADELAAEQNIISTLRANNCIDEVTTQGTAPQGTAAESLAAKSLLERRMIRHARALERLVSARARLQEALPETREEVALRWLDEAVVPGRVVRFGQGGGAKGRRLVFVTERRGETVGGIRETGARARFALERIGRVYEKVYALTDAERAFTDVRERRTPALDEPRRQAHRAELDQATEIINNAIERVVAEVVATPNKTANKAATGETPNEAANDGASRDATARKAFDASRHCTEALWQTLRAAEAAQRAGRDAEILREEVWQPFARRARVLERFGYLDFARERVTERGRWLADLRVDHPLLVGETLANDLLSKLEPHILAGCLAAIAADAERSYGELALDDKLVTALDRFERIAHDIADAEWKQELESALEMNYSAAAAAARWAQEAKWETLVRQTGAEEGDLFRMLSRVGEALMQIGNLHETHPEAARGARAAAAAILREPVRSDE